MTEQRTDPTGAQPPAARHVGAKFPPYTLGRLLGRGGSADVYLGTDELLKRPVAVKIPRELHAYDECRQEFEQHQQGAAGRARHPAIVAVYGWDELDGTPYLAMEYVRGTTLLQLLRSQVRLRWQQAIRVARDIADGLAAAHRLGCLHRDLKPENVLVTAEGRAKLTDFYPATGESLANADGSYDYFGTPGYSAPEQVRGEEDRIDARADLYALGVILYEMLEGTPLHGRGSTERVLANTLGRRARTRIRASRDVPTRVSRLVNSLVQENPRKRPADAVRVLEMIDRCAPTPA